MYDDPTSFEPFLPNVFQLHAPLLEREELELANIRRSPTLRKVLNNTLAAEYSAFLGRSPLKQSSQDLVIQHAYLAGMYALAASLLTHPNLTNR